MMAIIVEHCAECPFVLADETPWYCDAKGFDNESNPRKLPDQKIGGVPWAPPPDWCPLRDADRLVTLRSRP